MERKRHLAVKVTPSETKGEKTALIRVEGRQKQNQKSRGKYRDRVISNEIARRLITEMVRAPLYPPAFDAMPVLSCRRRFVSNENQAIASVAFTIAFGHRQFLVVTDTSGNAKCYADVWRIKSISVWCINYVDNATTVNIYPHSVDLDSNCFNDREAAFSCSSRSEARPGSMKIIPARDTPLGSWHKTSTVNPNGTLFTMNADYGGASSGNWATITLDIEFEYVLNLVGSPQSFTVLTTNTTPGTLGGTNFGPGSAFILQDINVLN